MPIQKGNFSCHSFSEEGRERYDNMTWNSRKPAAWEETNRLRKQHQEICRTLPGNFTDAKMKDHYKDLTDSLERYEKPMPMIDMMDGRD